jgi:filamentous hemagglutinin family protein
MNANRYRLVFNALIGMLVPVWEGARARGKGPRGARTAGRVAAAAAIAGVILAPGAVRGDGPAGLVPQMSGGNLDWSGAGIASSTASTMTIQQTQSRAVLNWQQFNLNPGERVVFDQQGNASWAALNQIWDANPSIIRGAIQAPGTVYLINQNGIVFGAEAQINVGSLIASALNVNRDAFERGLLSLPLGQAAFEWGGTRQQFETSLIDIAPGARLETSTGGRVMVLAPRVVNNGTISTPEGQTILAAGSKVFLTAPLDTNLRGFLVEVDPLRRDENGNPVDIPGVVTNGTLGRIVAERGNVTLASLAVNQMGRVSATTSVRVNGSVMLLARDSVSQASGISTIPVDGVEIPRGTRTGQVVLGPDSVTEVRPEVRDAQTLQDAQSFTPSSIEVLGRTIELQQRARIQAEGGSISLTAQAGQLFQPPGSAPVGDVRIYVDRSAVIDVAGTAETVVPVERNFISVELRGNELRDAPLQRDGVLRGETVIVDVRKGTPLADVSGYVGQITRTVGERTAAGGTVTLKSEGDVILRDGSLIDVSGGIVRYTNGVGAETVLLGADGRRYAMSEASPDRLYAGFADRFSVRSSDRWGVTRTFEAIPTGNFQPGYVEGKSAGTISILAHGVVLDGALRGASVAGPYQRTPQTVPLGGALVLGDLSQLNVELHDYKLPGIEFVNTVQRLPDGFTAATPLSGPWSERTQVSTALLNSGGFTRLTALANGDVTVPADVTLRTAPGGSIVLRGRGMEVRGNLIAPGGTIDIATQDTTGSGPDTSQFTLTVGGASLLSTAGLWVNDLPAVRPVLGTDPIAIGGGKVSIRSHYDLVLETGSVIDVSGGGYFARDGHFQAGNGGGITLASGQLPGAIRQQAELLLGAALQGWAPGTGGTVSLSGSTVTVGGAPQGVPGEFNLAPAFFTRGGFSRYEVLAVDGLTVADGVAVAPVTETLFLRQDAATRPTGSRLADVTERQLLPAQYRPAASLALGTKSAGFGDIVIGREATLRVDPGASIDVTAGRSVTVLGTIEAPGGRIRIGNSAPTDVDLFEPGVAIWLADGARVLARGFADVLPDARGFLRGEVLPGGTVELSALKGYIVSEAGSLIDVSGTVGTVDIARDGPIGPVLVRTRVPSNAGAVSLAAREGMLLDGAMLARGGDASVSGGALSVVVDQPPRLFYPGNPRRVVLSESAAFVPVGLRPGDPVDPDAFGAATINGRAFVALDTVRQGGFDTLSLKARDAIELAGPLDLTLRRAVVFDAPVMRAQGGNASAFRAGYVALGNTDFELQGTVAPTGGNARLTLAGDLVDVVGTVATQGFADVDLRSAGDVRLRAVLVDLDPSPSAISYGLRGALNSSANVSIEAAALYPTTFSDFAIGITGNPQGAFTLARAAGTASVPVLSAGGRLTVTAPVIRQEGVLKAPFGEIVLEAADALTLAPGSLTSVSGEGQLVPYGRTELSGNDYVYGLGPASVLLAASPEKRIALDAPALDLSGTLDLRGGGDLYAYEFTPGPGGSRDVLDPANSPTSFAILPTVGGGYAPFDHQYWLGEGDIRFGDRIQLTGVPGLADGSYTILPARYALMPGAWLVTPVDGFRDISATGVVNLLDGSRIVPGRLESAGLGGATARDARTAGFLVQPGNVVRAASEYTDTLASGFFAATVAGQLPADAGLVAIAARQVLDLGVTVLGSGAAGGRGAEVDITAPRLAVVPDGQAVPAGFVAVPVEKLNGLGASSLLLGGLRSRTDGGDLRIVAGVGAANSELLLANDAASALVAPDVMLAATGTVTLADGAAIRAEGRGAPTPGTISIDGDGAFLRVSAAPQATVVRAGFNRVAGVLDMGAGTRVTADGSLILDATRDTRLADTSVVAARAISIAAGSVSLGDVPPGSPGLVVTPALLGQIAGADNLGIKSYGTIDFYGDVTLGTVDAAGVPEIAQLVLDAAGIGGYGAGAKVVRAGEIVWLNSATGAGDPFPVAPSGTGTLEMVAVQSASSSGRLTFGAGDKAVWGFSAVRLEGARDVLFDGTGNLRAGGPLEIDATVITTTAGANHTVTATGALALLASGSAPADTPAALGGRLAFEGSSVAQSARIVVPSGRVTLSATGADAADGVQLLDGSVVDVSGRSVQFASDAVAHTAGGGVTFRAAAGDVTVQSGATVDVSGAAAGGDGGRLDVAAVQGRFVVDGTVRGEAVPGARGAGLAVDAGRIDAFGALNDAIQAGGFLGERSYRARTGDIAVGIDDTVAALRVALAADAGRIEMAGTLDARGSEGGRIELWARQGVTLASTADLDASAATPAGKGGRVTIGTAEGALDLQAGSRIAVAGNPDQGGREVLLRAPRTADDVAINALDTNFEGAAAVIAEAFRTYDLTTVGTAQFNAIAADSTAYMANAPAIRARLASLTSLRPGVEIVSPADLTLASDWNLAAARPAGEPGVLSLRAAGNLLLNGSLNDGFEALLPAFGNPAAAAITPLAGSSWSYRLVGGADMGAADPLSVQPLAALPDDGGSVRLAANRWIRAGDGFIDVAAGRDVTLGSARSVIYTAGVPGPDVPGFTQIYPPIIGGQRPSFTERGGDIRVAAQGDIVGTPGGQLVSEWLYREVRRNDLSNPATVWWVRFSDFQQGVGALGGGDVTLLAGGDVVDVSAVVPTNGRLAFESGVTPTAGDLREQGGGNLTVIAGRDVSGGVYYVQKGNALVAAGRDVGSSRELSGEILYPLLAVGSGRVDVRAGRNATIESAFNPTALRQAAVNTGNTRTNTSYFFTYAPEAGVSVGALSGTARLSNNVDLLTQLPGSFFTGAGAIETPTAAVYPGTVRVAAFSGDVEVDRPFTLFPSPRGQLELLAEGSVNGRGQIAMSDVLPEALPRVLSPDVRFTQRISLLLVNASEQGALFHSDPVLHRDYTEPVRIVARTGDVTGPLDPDAGLLPFGVFAKPATIVAGRDVRNVWFFGQNVRRHDVTLVQAGRDVRFDTLRDPLGNQRGNSGRFELGGVGELQVNAGRSVDLGNSLGVITRGNLNNPFLRESGAAIRVSTGGGADYAGFLQAYVESPQPGTRGYLPELTAYMRERTGNASMGEQEALAAFRALSPEGQTEFINLVLFTELKETGRDFTAGRAGDYERGYRAVARLYPEEVGGEPRAYSGDLNLFFSQLKTEQGGDIETRTPGGLVNAGLANPGNLTKPASQLGIVTARGGTVRSFVRDDFLVNQSRVFTLQGGDILIWSSEGNIDAGRGAKTATATPPPQIVIRGDRIILDTTRSVEGSGIGVLLAAEGVTPGDVDLIAPKGEVNAGDAGIRVAGNLNIAALRVIGTDNIQVGGVSTGVPVTAPAPVGGLAGTSSVAQDAAKSAQQATDQAAASAAGQKEPTPSFLTVEVIGLGDDGPRGKEQAN